MFLSPFRWGIVWDTPLIDAYFMLFGTKPSWCWFGTLCDRGICGIRRVISRRTLGDIDTHEKIVPDWSWASSHAFVEYLWPAKFLISYFCDSPTLCVRKSDVTDKGDSTVFKSSEWVRVLTIVRYSRLLVMRSYRRLDMLFDESVMHLSVTR